MLLDPNSYPFWIIIIAIIAGAIAIISRPFSTYIKFVYPNAKFEAIGNPFITEKELSRIVDSKDLNDFKDTLNALKDYKVSGENTFDIHQSLDNHLIQTMDMMRKDSSKKMNDFFDTYLMKIDIYLIKNALKNKIKDNEIDEKIISEAILHSTKKVIRELSESEKENIPNLLKNYGFEKEIREAVSEESVDFLKLDTLIDKHIITKLRQMKVPHKCNNAKQKFVNTLIDILTIKNVLRAKQLGYDEDSLKKLFIGEGQEIASWRFKEMTGLESVPHVISSLEGTSYYNALKEVIEIYNREKSVQVLENALDIHFLKLIKDISTQNYVTIGPTIRFLVSKEFEIKNLKIIAKGRAEGLTSDIINKHLIMEAG